VLVVGPNGAGKTNLLEALHVGTQGFSPRTRSDAQMIRFGESASRIRVAGRRGDVPLELAVTLRERDGKRASVNGAPLRVAESLRNEVATLVFTPDRLAIVKAAPAVRRAYFDRVTARLAPSRAPLAAEYAAAVAQRNGALRRVALGLSTRSALDPWTQQVVALGERLVAARTETVAALDPLVRERGDELGLPKLRVAYAGDPPTVEALEARVDRDLDRGSTGLGPHLDDITIAAGARELRTFGSQGEQRLAVLALLLAEATLVGDRRGVPPLLLLDDVLSELDPQRRRALVAGVSRGQTVITATAADALPADPAQLLRVAPGVETRVEA
jgi:DNA replication and repair protein RecF